jgi:type IV pilus assembly protein PilX
MKNNVYDTVTTKEQEGAALIVGLVMLLVLTVIGLSAMQGTSMQEKMSGNYRDASMALQAGETALRYVEEGYLKSLDEMEVGLPFGSCGGTCQIIDSSESVTLPATDTAGWDAQAIDFGGLNTTSGSAISPPAGSELTTAHYSSIPSFVVEYAAQSRDALDTGGGSADDTGRALYKNTVKASGGSATSEVILEAVFARRFR